MWSDELDDVAITQLTLAYVRRKQFEAQVIAVQVGRLFGGDRRSGSNDRINSDDMLRLMGIA